MFIGGRIFFVFYVITAEQTNSEKLWIIAAKINFYVSFATGFKILKLKSETKK